MGLVEVVGYDSSLLTTLFPLLRYSPLLLLLCSTLLLHSTLSLRLPLLYSSVLHALLATYGGNVVCLHISCSPVLFTAALRGSGVSPTTGDFLHWVSPTTAISYGVPRGTIVSLGVPLGTGVRLGGGTAGGTVATRDSMDSTARSGIDRLRSLDRSNTTSPDDRPASVGNIIASIRRRGFPQRGRPDQQL